jgi:predicted PurR-regulated permease PerM
MVCVILALYYATALKIVGLHYAITIGLITGLFAFIPYFGFLIGIVAAFGMALSQFEGGMMYAVIGAIFLVGQIFESYILLPKLIGNRVGLHPVWVLFSLLAGGVLFGFFGLLIAMPVAAAVGVIVRFIVSVYKKSTYGVPPDHQPPFLEQKKKDSDE